MERAAPSFLLVGRMMMSAIFIFSGIHKIGHPAATQEYMASMGMPATDILMMGAILIEIGAGAGLLMGLGTYFCSAALLIFMVPATLIFHTDFTNQIQMIMFMKNMAMMGGLLYILVTGPGPWSLDRYMNVIPDRAVKMSSVTMR